MPVKTLEWKDNKLVLVDQTRLPVELVFFECKELEHVRDAIKRLVVRGAPAIGVAAAYGVVIGTRNSNAIGRDEFLDELDKVVECLSTSRPTAVNLFWALDRMKRIVGKTETDDVDELKATLLREARKIHAEDVETCRNIGRHGSALIEDGTSALTHCNAGGLATSSYGTALSVFFTASEQGKKIHVYVDETRPLLQGARLTTWELKQRGIDVTLICDNMAAHVMKQGRIEIVITGADRIAANGDTANKIGTYGVALLAKAHGIPFYIAAPRSTFDMSLATGDLIPIEERDPQEVSKGFGKQTAPDGIKIYNPAFDVTPHELIKGFITEDGIIDPPYEKNFKKLFEKTGS